MDKKHKDIEFSSYSKMIQKLHDKGMIIDDVPLAIELIKARGYYNLVNRYKAEFYKPNSKEFKSNTHLIDLFYYHRIEDDLRNILFKFTINFEQRFKEALSFSLAQNLGLKTEDYLDPMKFRNKEKAKSITKFILNNIDKCMDNPTYYYKKEYGQIPPWIALSNLTLGQSRMLFSIFPYGMSKYVASELLPIHDMFAEYHEPQPQYFIVEGWGDPRVLKAKSDEDFYKAIENATNELIEFFRNMLSIINDFRNAFAHGNRVIAFHSRQSLNYKTLKVFVNEKAVSQNEFFNQNIGKNDLFACLISLILTMDKFDARYLIGQLETWEQDNTQTKIESASFYRFIKSCGLPKNFVERLKNIKIERSKKQKNQEFWNRWNNI